MRSARPALLLQSLALAAIATLGCTGNDGPAGPTTCGSTGPVTGCTVLVVQPGHPGSSNGCQVALSTTSDGGTRITLATSDSALAYPAVDATVTLPSAPVAGTVYSASQITAADVTAALDPNRTWSAGVGASDAVGDLSVQVNAYQPAASGATLHGSLNAILVAQTAGGALSLCAVF